MTSETAAKKDIQKLQRAIVEGLEGVKGQDIVVFNTADLSPLFERVIIASGTSNRQTKALASSVRDAVREAGFDKPRVEGEDNGEWIIVDCGAAVAHIMQPVIRQYYRLEEIWGTKPVRLKSAVEKAVQARQASDARPARKSAAKVADAPAVPARKVARKTATKAATTETAPARKTTAKAKPSSATRTTAKAAAPARKKTAGAPAKTKASLPKVVINAPKPSARKTPATKAAPARPAAKSPARKAAAKKKA
ncbi:MAG: ribosome silencing factor [Gammaproteobacteria bacterium]